MIPVVLQTAIVAFDHSAAPVIVHPDLKELKKDYQPTIVNKGKAAPRQLTDNDTTH